MPRFLCGGDGVDFLRRGTEAIAEDEHSVRCSRGWGAHLVLIRIQPYLDYGEQVVRGVSSVVVMGGE